MRTQLFIAVILLAGCEAARPAGVMLRGDSRLRAGENLVPDPAVAGAVAGLLQKQPGPERAVLVALMNGREFRVVCREWGIAQGHLVEAGLLQGADGAKDDEAGIERRFVERLIAPLQKRNGDDSLNAIRLHLSDAAAELAAEVRGACWSVQGTQETLRLRREAVKLAAACCAAAFGLRTADVAANLDLPMAQASLEQARLRELAAEADVAAARQRLNGLMGFPGEPPPWSLGGALPPLPEQEETAEDLVSRAVSRRAELVVAIRKVTSREDEAMVANANRPEFRQGWHRYRVMAADVRFQVRQVHARLMVRRERVERTRDSVIPLRDRLMKHIELLQDGSPARALDLIRVRQLAAEARCELAEALRDYWVARAELEKAVGSRLPTNSQESHE